MRPTLIPELLDLLAKYPSCERVANPYRLLSCQDNLRAYLQALCSRPYSGHLFVGEAPGYRGCAITGIPFSCERVLRSGCHPFLADLLPSLTLNGNVSERTASIVWRQISYRRSVPAFWNVFPFHPHPPSVSQGNRRPNEHEITEGRPYLDYIVQILAPNAIVSLGRIASRVTRAAYPHLRHASLSHPSYRGTAEFISGFAGLDLR